ncbi:class I SAM-dependent methyltransferase [Spirosoma rhododendri]|uniref:Methyltransferase domain-containing protein n=1 Tax=Spirosoma rhododendri TaxID=2728024 RepID=A0A7L5DS92_9BACT|nr:methyltransferase domain-containing protein [Spirosoma rhododendri]QJD80482.1 methyltransferase domain-containing protein [Spirosoma rhododendri]
MNHSFRFNFDAVTPVYDALSRLVFGRRLERAQTVWLGQISSGASVLVLGGGTGSLLGPLLARQPGRVLFLEASGQMLARAGRRMIQEQLPGQVDFQRGTEQDLQLTDQFDIIILPFVLDLFAEATVRDHMLPKLTGALQPGGTVLITDFVRTDRPWQRALLQLMIWFFRLTAHIETRQLLNWQRLLADTRLSRTGQAPQVWGMVSAESWRLT